VTDTIISRNSFQVIVSPSRPTVVIGERINPTGKDWLKQAMLGGDLSVIANLAREQVDAGAKIIDVNVAMPRIDEAEMLPRAVEEVQRAVDVPLCIDTNNTAALRAALAVCDGKVIVNSVNGEPERLEAVLPLVRERGAAVIGLTMDKESGLPKNAGKRVEIAARILEAVQSAGIPKSDLIIDCLTLAVSAEQAMGQVALDTMQRVSRELELNINMGVSNISFGLPERPLLNATFIAMAAAAGLTCAIINPHSTPVMEALLAADVLLGRDRRSMGFLRYYRTHKKAAEGQST
jgi:5-methyltetrahydrofolate--homocysteine methyltransferase